MSLHAFAESDTMDYPKAKPVTYKQFILPGALAVTGAGIAIEKSWNGKVQYELYGKQPHAAIKIDDYAQYAPAATVFALQAFGVKGQHNIKDAAIIYAMSIGLTTGSVQLLKHVTQVQRPDGSSLTSFPSGHTATAFAAAEFLRREYGQTSPWYGIAGYAVATGTGFLRMYNNRHWLGDVVAGAGFGIASTTAAYWLHNKIFHKKRSFKSAMVYPFYSAQSAGLCFLKVF